MLIYIIFFFYNTATTTIYTYRHPLALHCALPIWLDAYAAGEQDASARVARKREQVARLADGEGVALLYSIMHESRPTTGVWIAEYRDEIAVRLTGHVA